VPATNLQGGILDPPPEHVLVAALSFAATDAPSCQAAFHNLRELVQRKLAADIDEIDPESNPAVPSADSGELGVDTGYDTTGLTITVGVSASGFQRLGIPGDELPQDLIPINWGWFSDTPANPNEGDLVLQICADSSYVVEHVLRRIEHDQAASFTVVWTLTGEQRNGASHGESLTADSARALIGFHDGLANLNPSDPGDQQLIFVNQDAAPPYRPPRRANSPGPSRASRDTGNPARAVQSSRPISVNHQLSRSRAGPRTGLT
jgi:deferrochelatase/peroxidase EfeB